MQRSLTTVLFACTLLLADAQAPFGMMYNGGYNHLAALPGGRFVFSGPQHNVMCIDSLGNVLWRQQAGNISGDQGFLDVAPSGDGGAVLLTATDGMGSLQPTVIKVNPDGSTAWATVVQCADSAVIVGSMARTTSGSTVVLVQEGTPVGMRNLFSLSPLGAVEWMMRYDTIQGDHQPATVLPGPDGGVLLLVNSNRVVKVSATGQVGWARAYNMAIDGAQVLPSGNIALHIRPYELAQGVMIIDPTGWLVSTHTLTSVLTFFGAFERTPSGALVAGLNTHADEMQVMVMDTAGQLSSNVISTTGGMLDGGMDLAMLPDGRIATLANSGGLWSYFFRSDAALGLGTCFETPVNGMQTPLVNAFGSQLLIEPVPYLTSSFDPAWTALSSTTMVPCLSTALADQRAPALEVFPVPAHGGRLYVRNAPTSVFRYRIADVQGRAVLGGVCQGADPGIDVSSLAPGTYVLAIRSGATEQRIRFVR